VSTNKIENYTTKNYDIPNHYYMTIGAITCNKDIIHQSKVQTCTLQIKQLENPN